MKDYSFQPLTVLPKIFYLSFFFFFVLLFFSIFSVQTIFCMLNYLGWDFFKLKSLPCMPVPFTVLKTLWCTSWGLFSLCFSSSCQPQGPQAHAPAAMKPGQCPGRGGTPWAGSALCLLAALLLAVGPSTSGKLFSGGSHCSWSWGGPAPLCPESCCFLWWVLPFCVLNTVTLLLFCLFSLPYLNG